MKRKRKGRKTLTHPRFVREKKKKSRLSMFYFTGHYHHHGEQGPDEASNHLPDYTLPLIYHPPCWTCHVSFGSTCSTSNKIKNKTWWMLVRRKSTEGMITHICFPPKINRCCTGGIPSFSSTRSFIRYTCQVKLS